MQLERRSLTSEEIDHELLWLLVSLGSAMVLAVWLGTRLPTPQCVIHHLTGLPCPTCGATRSAWQFLHRNFNNSLRFNPLAFLAYCAIVAFDLYALCILLTRSPRFRLVNFKPAEKLILRSAAVAILLGNWVYLLAVPPF
ncbi:MAG: DUF2752 domain-containing protein [Chthoniobacterales bacterium]